MIDIVHIYYLDAMDEEKHEVETCSSKERNR